MARQKINDGLSASQRYRLRHPERRRAQFAAYRERNREKMREYAKKSYAKNPETAWEWNLRKRYGVDRELFEEMLHAQNAKCAICEKPFSEQKRRPSVDHDHQTGKIRALLCHGCNLKVAVLEEPLYPLLLLYLSKYKERKVG